MKSGNMKQNSASCPVTATDFGKLAELRLTEKNVTDLSTKYRLKGPDESLSNRKEKPDNRKLLRKNSGY
jgi:hypothetical protein